MKTLNFVLLSLQKCQKLCLFLCKWAKEAAKTMSFVVTSYKKMSKLCLFLCKWAKEAVKSIGFVVTSYKKCQSCVYWYVGELGKLWIPEFYGNVLQKCQKIVLISM